MVDDGQAFAERFGLFHVMGGEDDGDAVGLELGVSKGPGGTADRGRRWVRRGTEFRAGWAVVRAIWMRWARPPRSLWMKRLGALGEAELLKQFCGACGGGGGRVAEVAAMEVVFSQMHC